MARGHQKIQSQQKNAKKQAEIKKSKGHDQKTAAKAALVYTCGVCRSPTRGHEPQFTKLMEQKIRQKVKALPPGGAAVSPTVQ
ncbi:zinc finger protein 706 isoform X2 [Tachysurus ichikawai]